MDRQWIKKMLTKQFCLMSLCVCMVSTQTLAAHVEESKQAEKQTLVVKETVTVGEVTGQKADVQAQDVVTFTTIIRNSEEAAIADLLVLSDLPEGLTLVPGSLQVNGTAAELPTYLVEYDRTIAIHGVVVAGKTSGPAAKTRISYQATVDAPIPVGAALFKTKAVVSYGAKGKGITVNSNPVVLTVKDLRQVPDYPLLYLKHEAVVNGVRGTAFDVHAYQLVQLSAVLTNEGSKAARGVYELYMSENLRYEPDTFFVNGVAAKAEVIEISSFPGTAQLVCRGLQIPAQGGEPVKIECQVRIVPYPDPERNPVICMPTVWYKGDPNVADGIDYAGGNSVALNIVNN